MKTYAQYLEDLAARESSGRSDSQNQYGYLGLYQMGEAALIDAGYYKKSSANYNNDWSGKFTGKDGVYSKEDFCNYLYESQMQIYGKLLNGNVQDVSTGYAAPITPYTPTDIGQMSNEEFDKKEGEIMRQVQEGLINSEEAPMDFSGYTNSVTNDGHIFTQEDIGRMSDGDFAQNEAAINAQMNSVGIPTDSQMRSSARAGGAVYVSPYTRSDGTEVRGYYRSR